MKWIFGSFRKDALFLMIPGLFALALARLDLLQMNPIYLIFVGSFADSGHIYTTSWRTWLHPAERKRTHAYWLVPLAVATLFFTWSFKGLPYMWSFVIYATMHHYLKQYYGITKWYETLNRHSIKWSGLLSRALMIIPIVAYHFRANVAHGLYSEEDFFVRPNQALLTLTIAIYSATVVTWIGLEIGNYRQGYREWNRILSIGFSTLLYAVSFFFGTTLTEVLYPIVLGHGLAYMGLMSLSLERTRPQLFATFVKGLAVVGGTALACGLFESLVERSVVNFSPNPHAFWDALIIGVYVIPNGCHFIFDAWLWKKSHWESAAVYGVGSKPAHVSTMKSPSLANEKRRSS